MSALLEARRLLETVTPLRTDCGRLCDCACCQGDEEEGMLLFPGEGMLYAGCGFGRILEAPFELESDGLFVCRTWCPRQDRPLACRLFPLFLRHPYTAPELILDPRSRSICPLYRSGTQGLQPAFLEAARAAYALLLEDEACRRFLIALDRELQL